MNKIAFWSILLIVNIIQLHAQQTIQLHGTVTDDQTGEPLPYAQIVIKNKQVAAVTDHKGQFSLPLNEALPDDYMSVSFMGYDSYACSLSGYLNQKDAVIRLKPRTIRLNEVRISAKKPDLLQFMEQTARVYQKSKRKTPHIAKGHYREKAKIDNRYVMFAESIGYSIYCGKANHYGYKFFCENTRKADSQKSWAILSSESWFLPSKTKDTTKFSDVFCNSGRSNSSIWQIENFGPISEKYWNSFTYHLDSTYYANHEKLFGISFTKGSVSGSMEVQADTYQVIRINYLNTTTNGIQLKHKVKSDLSMNLIYLDNVPFIKNTYCHFKDGNLEYWNEYNMLIQKFDHFSVNGPERFSLFFFGLLPYVEYNPQSWELYKIPLDPDYQTICDHLKSPTKTLEEQFSDHSGKWWLPDYQKMAPDNNPNSLVKEMGIARKFVGSLKKLF